MRISDWSSDVCSSDLRPPARPVRRYRHRYHEPQRHRRLPGAHHGDGEPHLHPAEAERHHPVAAPSPGKARQARSPGGDRKSVVLGKSGAVRFSPGGRRVTKKKKEYIIDITKPK